MIRKIFLFLFLILFSCLAASAENFYIKNYDVDMKVDKTKTIHVTETIDVDFIKSSHGIIRSIPSPNAQIKNVKVSENNKVSYEYQKCIIKIGNPDKYIKGDHTYKISYDYSYLDAKNEFYFNIIGVNWNTVINHVNFNIEMPDIVDDSKTGLSIGKYKTEGFEGGASYSVQNNIIKGEVTRQLKENEGVTIRIELPLGYFQKNIYTMQNILLFIMFMLTLFCIVIWYIYGKDSRPVSIVSFYPPKDMSVLEIEHIYKGAATRRGIIATIVDLAQRGYLEIVDKKDEFKINKKKEYDGKDENEKRLINAIFANTNQTATEQKLKKSPVFYREVEKIIENANDNEDGFYEPEENYSKPLNVMKCFIGIIAVILACACSNFYFMELLYGGTVIAFLLFGIMCTYVYSETTTGVMRVLSVFIGNIFVIFPMYLGAVIALQVYEYNVPVAIFGYFFIFISIFYYHHMKKLNVKTRRIIGELNGLKKFIKTAELNKLELLVEQEPKYFYNILPFAYLFNLSDKWIKKFENIVKPDFAWSTGTRFDEKSFNRFTKTMRTLSSPSLDNGGCSSYSGGSHHSSSSGGGGHCGGGGGGGGGSSW